MPIKRSDAKAVTVALKGRPSLGMVRGGGNEISGAGSLDPED